MSSKKGVFSFFNVFWSVESKSDVHFRRPEPEILDNREKFKFPDYRGFSMPADENEYRI